MDPYSIPPPKTPLPDLIDTLPPLRVGWFAEGPFSPVSKEVQAQVRKATVSLAAMGFRVEPVTFNWEENQPISVANVLLVAEAKHYFRPLIKGREKELSAPIRALLDSPSPSLCQYLEALKKIELFSRDLVQFFSQHDLLLCPTAPIPAHLHNISRLIVDGQTVTPGHVGSITVTFGLSGSPAISVPSGLDRNGLPIGVQLVAGHFAEPTLLHAAAALETSFGSRLHPTI